MINALATTRTERQRQIDDLLRELELRRRQLYRLQAAGVQRAGMRELKHELQRVRDRLGAAITA